MQHRDAVLIVSVSPVGAIMRRSIFYPVNTFVVRPCENAAEPVHYVIEDGEEVRRDAITLSEIRKKITAESLALDLVREARTDPKADPEGYPGIFIAENGIVDPEALKAAIRAEQILCDRYIEHGNELFAQNRLSVFSDRYGEMLKKRAAWRGRDPEWAQPISDMGKIPCRYCQIRVRADAIVCFSCRNVLNVARFAEEQRALKDALKPAPATAAA